MKEVGLMPSNTGKPGGKQTGQQMMHYIIKGGPFEKSCKRLLSERFRISWAEAGSYVNSAIKPLNGNGKSRNKYKYSCNSCGVSVWGKPNMKILCGTCQVQFVQHNNDINIGGQNER